MGQKSDIDQNYHSMSKFYSHSNIRSSGEEIWEQARNYLIYKFSNGFQPEDLDVTSRRKNPHTSPVFDGDSKLSHCVYYDSKCIHLDKRILYGDATPHLLIVTEKWSMKVT